MKPAVFFVILCAALAACSPDETVSGFADPVTTYRISQLNGAPFSANATIRFPQEGTISGQAPCNAYSATQTAPYPWFAIGPIVATRRACAEIAAESTFFETLAAMRFAEVRGPIVILSGADSIEMVFQAE